MKHFLIFLIIFLVSSIANAQEVAVKAARFNIGVQYTQEFVIDGYVRVREWELVGDKMDLRDVGVDTYSALQARIEMSLRNDAKIKLLYDHFFMRGSATFDRDIFYNGTIIDGRAGIDVSPTRYYRLSGIYAGKLLKTDGVRLSYLAGLVYDHIVFYLDGKVSVSSPRNEVYEGFGKQALPYPFIGITAEYEIGDRGRIYVETSGTYIPKFKSFFTEGGNIHLQYSNFLADVKYTYGVAKFHIGVGGKLRHMKLFQESREDTNELWTLTAGPYMEVVYRF